MVSKILSSQGRHRIQAVAELTGIATATLRAWERRYGVPVPSRSEGGYRLYSEVDVDLLQRMRALVEGGLAPAEAARLVLERHRTEPLDPGEGPGDAFDQARERILSAATDFDDAALETAVSSALTLGRAHEVFQRVLAPALVEVGDRWHAGELGVAQEHLASEVIERSLRLMVGLTRPGPPAPRALLACIDGEQHRLALYGVALELSDLGVYSVILGARTPPEALAQAVAVLEPRLIGLSATVKPDHPARLFNAYGRACGDRPWIVGGAAAGDLRRVVERAGGRVAEPGVTDLRPALLPLLRRA